MNRARERAGDCEASRNGSRATTRHVPVSLDKWSAGSSPGSSRSTTCVQFSSDTCGGFGDIVSAAVRGGPAEGRLSHIAGRLLAVEIVKVAVDNGGGVGAGGEGGGELPAEGAAQEAQLHVVGGEEEGGGKPVPFLAHADERRLVLRQRGDVRPHAQRRPVVVHERPGAGQAEGQCSSAHDQRERLAQVAGAEEAHSLWASPGAVGGEAGWRGWGHAAPRAPGRGPSG